MVGEGVSVAPVGVSQLLHQLYHQGVPQAKQVIDVPVVGLVGQAKL